MRPAITSLVILVAWSAGISRASELSWYDWQGELVWRVPVTSAPGRPTTPLSVGPWFEPLPQLDLTLIGQATVRTGDFEGRVLLLDFWASWCEPCLETLPWLQSLQQSKAERGLEVLTVNMQEPDDVARQFARTVKMTLPIARYTLALQERLQVDSLPTLIVVDRQGRIRKRFNGYREGLEGEIADLVDTLLGEDVEGRQSIAEIESGGGTLQVRWSRRIPAPVLGLTVAPGTQDGAHTVLAATGWEVFGLDGAGEASSRWRVGPGVERLLRVGNPPGTITIFGYRAVGKRLVRFSPGDAGDVVKLEAPSNVLDITTDFPGGLLLATVSGLERIGPDGASVDSRTNTGPVWQVAPAKEPDQTLALLDGGKLHWIAGDLETLRESTVPASSRVLVAGDDGFGLSSPVVIAAAAGRLLPGGEGQVAVATEGHLLLLDADSGRERFSARWPGIAALAAADLDGDGLHELILGSGKRVTALEAIVSETQVVD